MRPLHSVLSQAAVADAGPVPRIWFTSPAIEPPPLTSAMLVVFAIIGLALLLFILQPVPLDVTSLLVIVLLVVLEPWTTISPTDGIAGFSRGCCFPRHPRGSPHRWAWRPDDPRLDLLVHGPVDRASLEQRKRRAHDPCRV